MKRAILRLSQSATSATVLGVSLVFLVTMSLFSLYASFDALI